RAPHPAGGAGNQKIRGAGKPGVGDGGPVGNRLSPSQPRSPPKLRCLLQPTGGRGATPATGDQSASRVVPTGSTAPPHDRSERHPRGRWGGYRGDLLRICSSAPYLERAATRGRHPSGVPPSQERAAVEGR